MRAYATLRRPKRLVVPKSVLKVARGDKVMGHMIFQPSHEKLLNSTRTGASRILHPSRRGTLWSILVLVFWAIHSMQKKHAEMSHDLNHNHFETN